MKLVYRVKISLPNGDGLFKQGMPAEAILDAGAGGAAATGTGGSTGGDAGCGCEVSGARAPNLAFVFVLVTCVVLRRRGSRARW